MPPQTNPVDAGIPDVLGAIAGADFISTNPDAVRC
jgi:hypothetical protein